MGRMGEYDGEPGDPLGLPRLALLATPRRRIMVAALLAAAWTAVAVLSAAAGDPTWSVCCHGVVAALGLAALVAAVRTARR